MLLNAFDGWGEVWRVCCTGYQTVMSQGVHLYITGTEREDKPLEVSKNTFFSGCEATKTNMAHRQLNSMMFEEFVFGQTNLLHAYCRTEMVINITSKSKFFSIKF